MVKDVLVSNLMIMYLSSKEGNGENAQNFIQYLREAEIKPAQEIWFLMSAAPIPVITFPQLKL